MADFARRDQPAKIPADRGEFPSLMEPVTLAEESRHRPALHDLAIDLAARSASFRRSLPPSLLASLATLVRSMHCYFSNLIEGHDTHPVDIERALKEDFSDDPRQRDLQEEATAHIAVQRWIDEGRLAGRAFTVEGVLDAHRRFCELLPKEFRFVTDPATGERVEEVPGELRHRDVRVGEHVPISPGAVPRFQWASGAVVFACDFVGGAGRIYKVFPGDVRGSGDFYGRPDAAGSAAGADPSVSGRRDSDWPVAGEIGAVAGGCALPGRDSARGHCGDSGRE